MPPVTGFIVLALAGGALVSFGYTLYYHTQEKYDSASTAVMCGLGAILLIGLALVVSYSAEESKRLTRECLEDKGTPMFSGRDQVFSGCAYPPPPKEDK